MGDSPKMTSTRLDSTRFDSIFAAYIDCKCEAVLWQMVVVQSKFKMGTPRFDNYHQSLKTADRSFGSMCPGLAERNDPLACVSARSVMKFCDDTPSVAMPPR